MAEIRTEPGPCDLIVFTAHPDDAELNCGGTLALAAEEGWRTAVVDFTRGELATRGSPEERAEEALRAAEVLGLGYRINLGLPDGRLHDRDEHRLEVVRLVRRMRPRVVIAPPLEDHHPDHAAVGKIVSRSYWLCGISRYSPDLEPWRPPHILHYLGSRASSPEIVVDIGRVYERRARAVACYRSQFHDPGSREPSTRISHPEFLDWVNGALRRWGFLIGAGWGEGYTSPVPVAVRELARHFGGAEALEP